MLKIAGYLCAKTQNFAQCLWITKPKNINPRTEWIHKIQTVYQSLEYCVDEIEHLVTEETKQKMKKIKQKSRRYRSRTHQDKSRTRRRRTKQIEEKKDKRK